MVTENLDQTEAPAMVQIHLVFDYTIQHAPRMQQAANLQQQLDFNVLLDLSPNSLDERGYPDPRAMWYAERMFLKAMETKHDPDVRILAWRSHLKDDPFILSEYAIRLPSSGL